METETRINILLFFNKRIKMIYNLIFSFLSGWFLFTVYMYYCNRFIVIQANSVLSDKINFLKQVPAYKTTKSLISNTISLVYYIEDARKNNKSVLINGNIMGIVELDTVQSQYICTGNKLKSLN
jgi:hypothetical protein